MERCIIGFDIGTSSLKTALTSAQTGEFVDFRTFDYQVEELYPGVSPCDMYTKAIQEVLDFFSQKYDITAISLATQMYSVCREIDGKMYVYQWNSLWDRRPHMEKDFQEDLYRSGCLPDTIFGAYKVATASPEMKGSFVPYGVKEYIIEYLTGICATDMTTASASGLYDTAARKWNTSFAEGIGLDIKRLPKALVHNEIIGKTKTGILPRGLAADVVPGLGDGMSASYACRHISNLCGNLGTSMAVRRITNQVVSSKESGLWAYAMDMEHYLVGGISSNSCSVLTWGKEIGYDVQELYDTKQVMFLPWLYGERAPFWSSDLRGTFLGISKDTDKKAIGSALLKSIAFTFSTIVNALEKYRAEGEILILGGGGSKSAALVSVISGSVDADIAIMDNMDYLVSIGAVMSASEGTGIPVNNNLSVKGIIKPTGKYKEELAKWREVSIKMADFYRLWQV